MNVLAVLDTMYNWKRLADGHTEAPRYFRINPRNTTGRRLYRLIGEDNQLLVTNCCKEIGSNSNSHGTPDSVWLSENLIELKEWFDLLLICGGVAKKTYRETDLEFPRVMHIMHPAARTWTKSMIEETIAKIQNLQTLSSF